MKAKQKKEATYPHEGGFGLFTTPCCSNEQSGIVNEPIHARQIAAEISEKTGVSLGKVNQIFNNFKTEKFETCKGWLAVNVNATRQAIRNGLLQLLSCKGWLAVNVNATAKTLVLCQKIHF